jgi:hypothetical protein
MLRRWFQLLALGSCTWGCLAFNELELHCYDLPCPLAEHAGVLQAQNGLRISMWYVAEAGSTTTCLL